MRSFVFSTFMLATFAWASATTTPAGEEALRRAVDLLTSSGFRFEYSFWPSPESTAYTTGSGYGDLTTTTWHYTVATDPAGSADGTWIIKDGTWYQNGQAAAPDFTFMGVAAIIAPFASYEALSAMQEGFVPLAYLGRELVDGLEAEHYRFSTEDMPMYGTSVFDAYLSESGNGFEGITLVFTPEGGRPNRVAFSHLGESMEVTAP